MCLQTENGEPGSLPACLEGILQGRDSLSINRPTFVSSGDALLGLDQRLEKTHAKFRVSRDSGVLPRCTRGGSVTALKTRVCELSGSYVKSGGEGEIRTHVPELPDHPISSRRRCDHFGTSPVNLKSAVFT